MSNTEPTELRFRAKVDVSRKKRWKDTHPVFDLVLFAWLKTPETLISVSYQAAFTILYKLYFLYP